VAVCGCVVCVVCVGVDECEFVWMFLCLLRLFLYLLKDVTPYLLEAPSVFVSSRYWLI
jgi:hypothetical protein